MATNRKAPRTAFKKGQSGNPAGRPKGARHKLTEAFWSDLHGAWEKHGAAALIAVAISEPGTLVKVVASVMPKEVQVDIMDSMTAEQLDARIAELAAELGLAPMASAEDQDEDRTIN